MILDTSNLDALDITSGTINYNNLAPDTCSLTREYFGASPLDYGDDITITRKGVTIFKGRVSSVSQSVTGASTTESIEVQNEVGWIDRIIYSETKRRPIYGYMVSLADTKIKDGAVVPLDELLQIPYDYASPPNLILDTSTGLSGIDYTPSGQESCWGIMQHLISLHSSVRATLDYSNSRWRWTTREKLSSISLDASSGMLSNGAASKKIANISVKKRVDLQYPAVCLTGGVQYNIGGAPNTEGALVYHVTESLLGVDAYGGISRYAQAATKQRNIVKGAVLPAGLYDYSKTVNGKTMSKFLSESPKMLKFLLQLQGLGILKKFSSSVKFSEIALELMSAEDAFPLPDDVPPDEVDPDDLVPANYQLPDGSDSYASSWATVAIFKSGSFPASVESKLNVWGLRWCKAKFRMRLALTVLPEQLDDYDALLELFNYRANYTSSEGTTKERPFCQLEFDVVLINRERKSYYPGDLSLADNDPDYDTYEPELPEYPEYLTAEQLKGYADEVWSETRTLLYDGSVTLEDCDAHPCELLNSKLSIVNVDHIGSVPATPVQSVTLDLATNNLTVQYGSKDPLGIAERVDLYRQTRATLLEAMTSNDNPAAQQAEEPLDSGITDALAPQTIVPQITAAVATMRSPKESAQPFTVYRDGGKVYLKGGTKRTLTGDISLDDLDITDIWKPSQRWYISTTLDVATGKYTIKPRYSTDS